MKVGRNAPCPCGSGLKYKKCCLGRAEQRRSEQRSAGQKTAAPRSAAPARRGEEVAPKAPRIVLSALPGIQPGCRLSPALVAEIIHSRGTPPRLLELGLPSYALYKVRLDDRWATDAPLRRAVARHRRGWTLEKVRAQSTPEIEERLSNLGVDFSRDRFVEQAQQRSSAWSFAERWAASDEFCGSHEDLDWLGLAFCELWRRLLPARPSMETLDDWMQEGYDLSTRGLEAQAAERWWQVWVELRTRFEPHMQTMEQAKEVFDGVQSLGNWYPELELLLHNTGIEDRRFAELGQQLCRDWIRQFVAEPASTQVGRRTALANFLVRLRQTQKAEALLRTTVEQWPTSPWGYLALAELHARIFPPQTDLPKDLAQARRWLERGMAAVGDGERGRAALQECLDELGGR